MVLGSFERRLHTVLLGMIRRTTWPAAAGGCPRHRASLPPHRRDHAPSQPPSRRQVILRQASERHHRNIRRDCCDRNMRLLVQHQLVVDFVSENDQIVFPRQLGKPAPACGAYTWIPLGLLGLISTIPRVRCVEFVGECRSGPAATRSSSFNSAGFQLNAQLAKHRRVKRIIPAAE